MQLSNAQLLERAQVETVELKFRLDAANEAYYQHSEYARLHLVRDMNSFHRVGADLKADALSLEMQHRRSMARVEHFLLLVAGAVREPLARAA